MESIIGFVLVATAIYLAWILPVQCARANAERNAKVSGRRGDRDDSPDGMQPDGSDLGGPA